MLVVFRRWRGDASLRSRLERSDVVSWPECEARRFGIGARSKTVPAERASFASLIACYCRSDTAPIVLSPFRRQKLREEHGALSGARRDLCGGVEKILVSHATIFGFLV